MRLATTALEEFWGPDDEGLVFLHEGCRLWSRRARWEPLGAGLLESPWDPPGALESGVAECRAAHEELLAALAPVLGRAHGVPEDPGYWRLVVGPSLLGVVAHTYDRSRRIAAARARWPSLSSVRLPETDLRTPRDAAQDHAWRYGDLYNLHLATQLLRRLEVDGPERPWTGAPLPAGPAAPGLGRRAASALWTAALRVSRPSAAFSHLQVPRRAGWALAKAAGGRAWPVFCEVPPGLVPSAGASDLRRSLGSLPVASPLARLAASLLPRQLPAAYVEGFGPLRAHALRGWRRTPRALLTATGWFLDDAFKILAAETRAAGGRIAVVQHGGAYGALAGLDMERHERSVADEYWTWGWEEPAGVPDRAAVVPVPHPLVSSATGGEPARPGDPAWSLVSTSPTRHPYVWYLANLTGWDHFEEYLDWRRRFLAGLDGPTRARGEVRLHPADEGWSHRERLAAEFPDLAVDASGEPWLARHRRLAVAVIDHPQTSLLESLAADLPTLLFWNPERWPLKPSAEAAYASLRAAGILHDTPEAAAAALRRALGDGDGWWRAPAARAARAAFCARYARGSSDWPRAWASRLTALAGPARGR